MRRGGVRQVVGVGDRRLRRSRAALLWQQAFGAGALDGGSEGGGDAGKALDATCEPVTAWTKITGLVAIEPPCGEQRPAVVELQLDADDLGTDFDFGNGDRRCDGPAIGGCRRMRRGHGSRRRLGMLAVAIGNALLLPLRN